MGFKVGKLLESICMFMHRRHHKTTAGHHRHHCRHHFVYVNVTNTFMFINTVILFITCIANCASCYRRSSVVSWHFMRPPCWVFRWQDGPWITTIYTNTQTHARWAWEQLLVTRSSYYASQWSHRAMKLSHSVILLSVHQDISCLCHHSYPNHHLSKSFLEAAPSYRV